MERNGKKRAKKEGEGKGGELPENRGVSIAQKLAATF